MAAGTIKIIQGEDFTLQLAFKNPDGSSYNLTSATINFVVRKNATSSPVISKTISSFGTPTTGIVLIPLSGADTDLAIRSWQYEVTLVDALGADHPSGVNPFLVTNEGESPGVAPGGTTGQYLRKSSGTNYDTDWDTIDKSEVGLGNVDNTSDANKPISTATQAALDAKQLLDSDLTGSRRSHHPMTTSSSGRRVPGRTGHRGS
jgi:hypothetical protein